MTRRRELHGQRDTRLYSIWKGMNQRCNDPKHTGFARYGGAGITICAEWGKFSEFARWAKENGYANNLTLDRRQNKGPYSPENCHWATPKEQAANSSIPVLITAFGETMNISDWTKDERCNVNRRTLCARIAAAWDAETAITKLSRQAGKVTA